MTINRQWLLDNRPVGMIGPEHFKYVETTITEPGEGEVLIRNLMSVSYTHLTLPTKA